MQYGQAVARMDAPVANASSILKSLKRSPLSFPSIIRRLRRRSTYSARGCVPSRQNPSPGWMQALRAVRHKRRYACPDNRDRDMLPWRRQNLFWELACLLLPVWQSAH